MIRTLFAVCSILLVSCSTLDRDLKQQQARIKLDRELSTVEIRGNPVDLTIKLLDEAYIQMQADESVRASGAATRFAVGQTPGYRVVIGEKIYPKFREKFLGEGVIWRDRIVDMSIALDSSDIKVITPIRTFELKNRGGDRFVARFEDKSSNPENDLIQIRAHLIQALDSEKYLKSVSKIKKQYPDFEWR